MTHDYAARLSDTSPDGPLTHRLSLAALAWIRNLPADVQARILEHERGRPDQEWPAR